jgi:predicted transcriptional regulator
MYLQTHLLSLSLRLAPEDAKAIAQLAGVAQGIVNTSVKLEQLKAERQDNGERSEKIADIVRRIRETVEAKEEVKAAEKAENARLARERGWCDSDISDDLAAKIYDEKTCPWRRKPDWPPG